MSVRFGLYQGPSWPQELTARTLKNVRDGVVFAPSAMADDLSGEWTFVWDAHDMSFAATRK